MYKGKYSALLDYLNSMNDATAVTLTTTEIEGIIGFKLPASAFKYAAWWENESEGQHSHARAWLDAGWKTSDVIVGEKVTFYNHKR